MPWAPPQPCAGGRPPAPSSPAPAGRDATPRHAAPRAPAAALTPALAAARPQATITERYFWDPLAFWEGATAFPFNYYIPRKLISMYILELGFYLQVRGGGGLSVSAARPAGAGRGRGGRRGGCGACPQAGPRGGLGFEPRAA
jgi:hypothetical protein